MLVHQLSKRATQNPFKKNRGRVSRVAFHPTKPHPPIQPPTEVKVMLYAYWPAGESWFDDVKLRPASAEELATEDARRKR